MGPGFFLQEAFQIPPSGLRSRLRFSFDEYQTDGGQTDNADDAIRGERKVKVSLGERLISDGGKQMLDGGVGRSGPCQQARPIPKGQ